MQQISPWWLPTPSRPGVNAGPDGEITCLDPTTQLFGSSDPNVTYQWLFNGVTIAGATKHYLHG